MKEKNNILKFQIISFITVSILGTLLHFTYDLSNNNFFISLFSATNESTWEHLKLAFFPMLLTTIIGYFYIGKNLPNYLCAKLTGILISPIFIITFFYTYTGILGKSIDTINIISFYFGIFLGEYFTYKKLINNTPYKCNSKLAIIILSILTLCFFIFTYYPPKIGLFKDPITHTYGL